MEIGFLQSGMGGYPTNMMISQRLILTVSMIHSLKESITGHHPTMDSRSTHLGIQALTQGQLNSISTGLADMQKSGPQQPNDNEL